MLPDSTVYGLINVSDLILVGHKSLIVADNIISYLEMCRREGIRAEVARSSVES